MKRPQKKLEKKINKLSNILMNRKRFIYFQVDYIILMIFAKYFELLKGGNRNVIFRVFWGWRP